MHTAYGSGVKVEVFVKNHHRQLLNITLPEVMASSLGKICANQKAEKEKLGVRSL